MFRNGNNIHINKTRCILLLFLLSSAVRNLQSTSLLPTGLWGSCGSHGCCLKWVYQLNWHKPMSKSGCVLIIMATLLQSMYQVVTKSIAKTCLCAFGLLSLKERRKWNGHVRWEVRSSEGFEGPASVTWALGSIRADKQRGKRLLACYTGTDSGFTCPPVSWGLSKMTVWFNGHWMLLLESKFHYPSTQGFLLESFPARGSVCT